MVRRGTLVRRVRKEQPRTFRKPKHNYFEPDLYEVTNKSNHLLKPLFSLAPVQRDGGHGANLRQLYYREEIQVVNPEINRDNFPNFQITDRRISPATGRDEVFLKFTDYNKPKYDCWMVEDTLNTYLSRVPQQQQDSDSDSSGSEGVVSIADVTDSDQESS